MTLDVIVEQIVSGLGYELVDLERAPGGLLRVFIDLLPVSGGSVESVDVAEDELTKEVRSITIADCEKVSDQLSHVFLVEEIDYDRLEVSSPGLDRPLKKMADFVRFVGNLVSIRLKRPVDGRKQFVGLLLPVDNDELKLEFELETAASKLVKKGARLKQPVPTAQLKFKFEDVDKARLVPQVDFRSHKR
ncbi:ribosome maturation factor RimP [Ampullimonas aquatilis]|uniref:ribosome maturation factor RimP n=1 Tax=Ampullimonas aquatilis TaxID=1341549 RepID=UPI003C712B10